MVIINSEKIEVFLVIISRFLTKFGKKSNFRPRSEANASERGYTAILTALKILFRSRWEYLVFGLYLVYCPGLFPPPEHEWIL